MPDRGGTAARILALLVGLSLAAIPPVAAFGGQPKWGATSVHATDAGSDLTGSMQSPGSAHRPNDDVQDNSPDWIEPRGLSVVDLVGQVPEEILHGMIIAYSDSAGLVVYESGLRAGDLVTVTAEIYPRVHEADWAPNGRITVFPCLGQRPYYDHMGSVVPASTLRVYDGSGQEVTGLIEWMTVTAMGLQPPLGDSSEYTRYPEQEYGPGKPLPLPISSEGLDIPPNSGCVFVIPGLDLYPLTGVFSVDQPPPVDAVVVGTQYAAFRSYIGVGGMGIFAPLMQQLRARYPDRHGRIALDIPSGASHFLVKFPPTPADAYADQRSELHLNANRRSGGTYRLSGDGLSTDLIFSGAFPLDPAWRDSDQSPGAQYLPVIRNPSELAPPEYVIPAGIAYDTCFTLGNCPDAVLDEIHAAVMPLQIVYLSISGSDTPGQWLPLRMAGPAWRPGVTRVREALSALSDRALPRSTGGPYVLYLPLVVAGGAETLPGSFPRGWADGLGRMLACLPGNE